MLYTRSPSAPRARRRLRGRRREQRGDAYAQTGADEDGIIERPKSRRLLRGAEDLLERWFASRRVGGGVAAKKGDFVGVHLLIEDLVTGAVYLDTKANKKPVAFIFQKKPLLTPVCEGLEEAVASMRRGGVRDATVPARLAYGAAGAALANGAVVPPNRDLKMRISIEDISPSYL